MKLHSVTFALITLSIYFVLITLCILNPSWSYADSVNPHSIDETSAKRRSDTDVRKSFCSKIEELKKDFQAIALDFNTEKCGGTTAEASCFRETAEKYQNKISEYFMTLAGELLLNGSTELIADENQKNLIIKSHAGWLEYQSSEFRSIEIFYHGDGSMYPRSIAQKKSNLLKARGDELLGYLEWHCANS